MAQNPWLVDSINAFYFLNCPECAFNTKEENCFQEHAMENHPLSFVLFGKSEGDLSVLEDTEPVTSDNYIIEHMSKDNLHLPSDSYESLSLPIKQECDESNLGDEEFLVDHNSYMDYCEPKLEHSENTLEEYSWQDDPLSVSKKVAPKKRTYKFSCDICGCSFNRNCKLKHHIEVVHEGKKPFKCKICGVRFTEKGNLKKHTVAKHEGKKPFQCWICGYSCPQSNDLKKHISLVHEGNKPYKCSMCQSSFSQNGKLLKHIAAVHEGQQIL